MADRKTPNAPTGLAAKGRKLWREVTGTYDLRPDELTVLEAACREVDLIAELEKGLKGEPLTVSGSMGQLVAHPLIGELRQHRGQLGRLLAQLKLPDDSGRAAEDRSSAARHAANARWRRAG